MLPIVLEDRWLVVVDKPAGLPTSGRTLEDPFCAQAMLSRQLGEHVWAVHQLDAGTTGLNLFVRRKSGVPLFVDKLKKGEKRYLAVGVGTPAWDERTVDAPLGWDEARRAWAVLKAGKAARSDVTVVRRGETATLFSVRIHTGRTHQVRLHLAHLGHPLVGDERYASPEQHVPFPRPALHAHTLRLPGVAPLEAPVPADLVALLSGLGIGSA